MYPPPHANEHVDYTPSWENAYMMQKKINNFVSNKGDKIKT